MFPGLACGETTPDGMRWTALSLAPDDGAKVPEQMDATGIGRLWIYLRLRQLAE